MKRFLAIMLAASLLLCFTACGDNSSAASNNTSSTASKKPASSSDDKTSSSEPEKDTRYRATREPKPEGFKYKEASILVLGDSITAGDGTPSGYRYSLFEQLYASGARFRFVGPNKSVADTRLTDKYNSHGGVGGRTIEQLKDNVNDLCNFEYDIVLVMIGRNDSGNLTGITDRYKAMLDAIIAKNPNASVYCGEAPPQNGQGVNDSIHINLNKKLPEICKEYTDKGNKVTYVSMNCSQWQPQHYVDAVHPNEAGNKIIATCYWDAILDEVLMINDSGDSKYVEPVHVNSLELSDSKLDIAINASKTITTTVSPANAEVKNVLWSSSDVKIAKVNGSGKITGLKEGKATITAKTLDGNIIKTCEVNVVKSTEPATTEVFTAKFTTSEWSGSDAKYMSNSAFATNWGTCADTPAITTASDINAGNNFKMTVNYKVSGNPDQNNSNPRGYFSSIAYNGFEIRIFNCVRTVALFANGEEIGAYSPNTATQDKIEYVLRVNNGKVTLSLNGEEVISCNSSGVSGSKKAELKIGDQYRVCEFTTFKVEKY